MDKTFLLYDQTHKAELYIEDDCFPQVKRAFFDLARDIAAVCGEQPEVAADIETCRRPVIVATYGKSRLAEELVQQGAVDLLPLRGKTEAFLLTKLDRPFPQTEEAYLVCGSDMRGTIYGIYELSKTIGVSPWYYWADVAIPQAQRIVLDGGARFFNSPSVKYRGIFINDERAFQQWSKRFSGDGPEHAGAPSCFVYKKIFELLLRLRANTLWPAMHRYSTAFYTVRDEDGASVNAKAANEYGVIIGSSHCEAMLRNNESEWAPWVKQYRRTHKNKGKTSYDYTLCPDEINAYWRERAEESKDYESIYTLGMRGVHDGGLHAKRLPRNDLKSRIALMENIISSQRAMLAGAFGEENMPPQLFIPYKEVAQLYHGNGEIPGVQLPEDVTVMYTDDNHGYLRQVPTEAEKQKHRRFGLYYHISYWGAPLSYLWLNTTPLPLLYEELKKAYESGIRDMWIFNVGDIKPSELSLSFLMQLACGIGSVDFDTIDDWVCRTAQDMFHVDAETARGIAGLVREYYRLNWAKRPEFQGREFLYFGRYKTDSCAWYSTENFGEADRILGQADALRRGALTVYEALKDEDRPAFYETVLYPVLASTDMLRKNLYWQKAVASKKAGDPAGVKEYTRLSKEAHRRILHELHVYNEELCGGKWKGIMEPYPRPYVSRRRRLWDCVYVIPRIRGRLLYPHPPVIRKPAASDVCGDGCICVFAEDFNELIPGRNGENWRIAKHLGRERSALLSGKGPEETELSAAAKAVYRLNFNRAGEFEAELFRIPTLNEAPGGTCRLAVGLDGGPPQILSGQNSSTGRGGLFPGTDKRWQRNVLENTERLRFRISVPTPGAHTLTVYRIDEYIGFEKIAIYTKGFIPSYLGPAE